MKREQIAAQLYTVRKFTQTEGDFAKAVRRVREIGYGAVELSGIGPLDARVVQRILDGEGVICCASHESEDLLFGQTDYVADKLNLLKCSIAVYAWPGERRCFADRDTVLRLSEQLNRAGEQLARFKIQLAYHHHHMELTRLGEHTALDMLFEHTDPRFVAAELDSYWLQYGGVNPAMWCRKMRGRLLVLHLKDYAITRDRQIAFAEVGAGNLDWKEIFRAAGESGCRWYAVEQDECSGDPFVSLDRSFNFLVCQSGAISSCASDESFSRSEK